jgi:hypothetical protein
MVSLSRFVVRLCRRELHRRVEGTTTVGAWGYRPAEAGRLSPNTADNVYYVKCNFKAAGGFSAGRKGGHRGDGENNSLRISGIGVSMRGGREVLGVLWGREGDSFER